MALRKPVHRTRRKRLGTAPPLPKVSTVTVSSTHSSSTSTSTVPNTTSSSTTSTGSGATQTPREVVHLSRREPWDAFVHGYYAGTIVYSQYGTIPQLLQGQTESVLDEDSPAHPGYIEFPQFFVCLLCVDKILYHTVTFRSRNLGVCQYI
jgi:hypothetical protein